MRYALGIDPGGSKCDAVLIDETGNALAWGRGGPTHSYYDTPEVVSASYTEAISEALQGVTEAEIGVGGYFPPGAAAQAIAAAGRIVSYVPTGELETAFASAQEEWGMVVLAGTGSFAYGRTADGRTMHIGGLGPILGDYGSAYAIGLAGLRAAFASHWTQARRTSLAEAIPRALGVGNLNEVFDLAYRQGISRWRIASVSKIVDQEAENGDRIAISCLKRAADELANLAVDVVTELGMHELDFPLIAIGSVAQRSRTWWEQMCQRVVAVAPRMRQIIPRIRPAVAAALLALREMRVAWTPELVERIVQTQQPVLEAAEQRAASRGQPN